MKYKKVLVVSNMYPSEKNPSYGIFVKNFCDQIRGLGYVCEVSALTKTDNIVVKLLKYLYFYTSTFIKCLLGAYDLVYIHYPSFSAAPVIMARRLRQFDVITNVHGTDVVPLKKEHEKMIGNTKNAFSYSKKVVVPSVYYKNLVIDKYNIDPVSIFVYPSGGVNEEVFHVFSESKKEQIKKEYGIDKDTFVIGYVSRINKAKGWDVFLRAIRSCCIHDNVRIFIVGSGEDDELLEKSIDTLPQRLKESITRYPLLPQVKLAEIYNLLDVFVFPTMSASESLGLVAIEAMACGTPVIASDYAAPAYYVENGVNGYKFPLGDSKGLSEIIEYFYLNQEELAHLQKGALDTAEKYSPKVTNEVLEKILTR